MRITDQHLAELSDIIAPLDTAQVRARYVARDFPRADAVRDLDKRYRWDLFYASGASRSDAVRNGDYTDAHLDTALRRIVAPLG